MSLSLLEISLAAFIILTAVGTMFFRDVLSAIVLFGAYSLGMALLYTFLLAPDVALTEAAIGAGVTTILLILTISRTVRPRSDDRFEDIHVPGAIAVLGFILMVGWVTFGLPRVGSPDAIAWANEHVTQYYLFNTYSDTGVQNAVTAVLAAYRGFDTFGEAVVVFAAGVAVLVVLNREVFS